MTRIHSFGLTVLDALSYPIDHYPIPRQHTQVVTEQIRFMPGGGAANTASALARMGLSVTLYSEIGDDLPGTFLINELEKCHVDTSGVHISHSGTTPFTFVGIHPDGERTFIHTPGTNRTMKLDDFDLDSLLDTDILLYQDLWAMPNIDGFSGMDLLAEAKRRKVAVLLDECRGFGPNLEILEVMLPHCDYFLPSLDDLRTIYPSATEEQICMQLLSHGARAVALKMGPVGSLLAWSKERVRTAALPADVVDATGAGDCWDAGFIAGLAEKADIATAARLGHACAAFCVEGIGGATNIPLYDAVKRRANYK